MEFIIIIDSFIHSLSRSERTIDFNMMKRCMRSSSDQFLFHWASILLASYNYDLMRISLDKFGQRDP